MLIVIVFVFSVVAAQTAETSESGGFIIVNADVIGDVPVSSSQELINAVNTVEMRFVTYWADKRQTFLVSSPDSALFTALDSISSRFITYWADVKNTLSITNLPVPLQDLLGQIADRFVIYSADVNQDYNLSYPIQIIDDTTAPVISGVSVNLGSNKATVNWLTDEFTDGLIEYGIQFGEYPWSVSDPLYIKEHSLTLPGLTRGVTHYYRIVATDLSGNEEIMESDFTLPGESFIYLPFMHR
jgi:hypothetical protein